MISRLKFELTPLVNEILDQFPLDIWTSATTTFLDPAIGGGQFVREIERRLSAAGRSDLNIKGRVFGYEEYEHRVRYAVNKYKLKGTYATANFLEMEHQMKFDAIVGNPPFQKDGKGRAEKLWPKFIQLAFDHVKDNGMVAIISPTSWTAGSYNIVKGASGVLHDIFHTHDVKKVELDCSSHFPGVGIKTGYFVAEKSPSTGVTTIAGRTLDLRKFDFLPADAEDFDLKLAILEKVLNFPEKFTAVPYTGGGINRSKGVDVKTPDMSVKTYVRGGNLTEVNYAYFADVQNERHAHKRKVIIPLSGAEKFMPFVDDIGIPFSLSSYLVELQQTDTYAGAISVFNSKLFKFLIQKYRTSGFVQTRIVKNLPKIKMDSVKTDADIYKIIGLTQTEIDYVESYC